MSLAAAMILGGCADTGSGPNTPASIEFEPFPAPAVAVGDTLRNELGVASPVIAVTRNAAGDVIADAQPTYIYADFNRDTALSIEPSTGVVVALKATKGAEGRIAARVGSSLQVIRAITVTQRPDSVSGTSPTALKLSGPDSARNNTTGSFSTTVTHIDDVSASQTARVNGWIVRYQVVQPSNPGNDTTAAAFMVDDRGRPSLIDTTDSGGNAGRSVRVRPDLFPVGDGPHSVEVMVTVLYRGQHVKGSPLMLSVPISR